MSIQYLWSTRTVINTKRSYHFLFPLKCIFLELHKNQNSVQLSSIVLKIFSNFLNTKKRNKAIGWLSTLCAKISLYCVSFHLKYFSMLLLNYFTDKERSIGKWKPCSGNGHQSSWPKNDWNNASLQRLIQIAPAREWTRGCIKEYFGRRAGRVSKSEKWDAEAGNIVWKGARVIFLP